MESNSNFVITTTSNTASSWTISPDIIRGEMKPITAHVRIPKEKYLNDTGSLLDIIIHTLKENILSQLNEKHVKVETDFNLADETYNISVTLNVLEESDSGS